MAGWRLLFLLGGVVLLIGGPQHPRGTLAEMLGHEAWLRSHALMTAGFVAFLFALIYLRRDLSGAARRWTTVAAVGTALQALEMAVHTAAVVDHANLLAGRPTPVLTTHLAMSMMFYPLFGITTALFIVAAVRHRFAGSPWIAWLGIAGAVAHGAAPPVVMLLGTPVLFPLLSALSVWMILAGVWPPRVVREAVAAARAGVS